MARVIGIDLGTTYSAVAVIGATGRPEILPNREGERITASVVQFLGEETLVGSSAKRSAPTAPQDVVQFVKRHMGEPQWRFVASDGAAYGAEQVSAVILRRLKEDAETALGEPVSDAVITVPAFFGDAMRTATKDAGRIAGLNVLRIINEPTAAALAYGLDGGADGTVLVYDLGGGTFDVTLMRLGAGSLEVVATSGDRNLGGYDWDNALMTHANTIVQEQGGPDLYDDDLLTAELRDKCELAKRALTTTASTKFFVTASGKTMAVQVSRDDFERVTRSLLNRTLDITSSLLEEAGTDWPRIDRVLLVGGSTHMPMVREAVAALSGKEPQRTVNPDEAVALGAAIQAHLAADAAAVAAAGAGGLASASAGQPELAGMRGRTVVVHDVTAHGIGTLALVGDTDQMRNFVLVKANTRVPARGSDEFQTVEENQRRLKVQITEGDDPDPDYVRTIGDGVFPMPPYPKGAPIRIDMAFDLDGVIFAEVYDGTTGRKIGDMEIAREANLTPEQVAEAIETMRKLEIN